MSVVAIERVDVGASQLVARVRVDDPALLRTSAVAGVAERCLELLPGLARHSCDNVAGTRFVDEMRDTETPHMLEHVAVELMALSGSPRSLKANTSWDFARDGRGVFAVTIPFDDDVVAIGALKHAVGVIEWAFGRGERLDVAALVASLKAARVRVTASADDAAADTGRAPAFDPLTGPMLP